MGGGVDSPALSSAGGLAHLLQDCEVLRNPRDLPDTRESLEGVGVGAVLWNRMCWSRDGRAPKV